MTDRDQLEQDASGRYTDDSRAAALALLQANAGDVAQTATQLGISRQSLTMWRNGAEGERRKRARGRLEAGAAAARSYACCLVALRFSLGVTTPRAVRERARSAAAAIAGAPLG